MMGRRREQKAVEDQKIINCRLIDRRFIKQYEVDLNFWEGPKKESNGNAKKFRGCGVTVRDALTNVIKIATASMKVPVAGTTFVVHVNGSGNDSVKREDDNFEMIAEFLQITLERKRLI